MEKALTEPLALPAENLIQQAIKGNASVETIERLLAMRRELKAEAAKEAFDLAMSAFQAECPVIEKKKEAKDGTRVLYRYAPLDTIISQIKDIMGKYGLSYAIQTIMTATHVKSICIAKHSMGHTESSEVDMPLATKTGIMSAPQQVASTITFGKRYAFCNAFGIMTGDEDNDAEDTTHKQPQTAHVAPQSTPPTTVPKMVIRDPDAPATTAQLTALATLLAKYNMPEVAFREAYKIGSRRDMKKGQASAAIDELSKRVSRGERWEAPMPIIEMDAQGEVPPTQQMSQEDVDAIEAEFSKEHMRLAEANKPWEKAEWNNKTVK